MKNTHAYWCIACLLMGCGCEKHENRVAVERPTYPALDESPPPTEDFVFLPETEGQNPPVDDTHADGWLGQQLRKEKLIKDLRAQAQEAGTEHPFVLTESEIEALSRLDDVAVF